jgi:LAO/AO transport system kinase
MTHTVPTLEALGHGGKAAIARALTLIETAEGTAELVALLDHAAAEPRGLVLGLTGPPGVGKSTLTKALIQRARAAGQTIAVVAVDPSSRISGGALLGDRTRLSTDSDDTGVFVRSMAARGRLGGLSDHAVASIVLMRALYDRVIVETVGIGQSEADIAHVADTVLLLIQPGSGDSLQFMKAGVMELPDIVAVTKAEADVEGALTLGHAGQGTFKPRIVRLSATTGAGLDDLDEAFSAHAAWLELGERLATRRAQQTRRWIEDAIRARHGSRGLATIAPKITQGATVEPFATIARLSADLDARLEILHREPSP